MFQFRSTLAALAVLATLAVPATLAEARPTDRSVRYHDEARQYLEAGKVNEAIIQLKNAIRTDPDNVKARLELGLIHLGRRAGPAAEKELKAARARGLPARRMVVALARAYLLQGKFAELLDEIQPGDYPAPVNAGIHAARADAHLGQRRPAAAAAALQRALEYADDDAGIYVALSRVLQMQGRRRDAEAAVDRALGLDAGHLEALLRKGDLRRLEGDLAAAADAFERAVTARPDDIRARLGHAAVAIGRDQDDTARADIDTVLVAQPGQPVAVYLQALLAARQGDYGTAIDLLQGVQVALAGHLPAIYLLGALSYAENQLEQAETLIEQFRQAMPDDVRDHKLLAGIHLRRCAPARAIAVLAPVRARWPDDFQLLALLGNAYMASRRYAEATELFEQAAVLEPDNTALQTRLAASRLGGGETGRAVAALESIVAGGDPNAGRANVLLILTHLRERDFDAALAAAETLARQQPDSPMADNFRGMIHLAKDDPAAARLGFEAALAIKPDYFPAILNLAGIDRRAGDQRAARRRYRSILAQRAGHLGAMIGLAELAFADQRPAAAIDWLEQAAAANPKAPAPRLRLVDTHLGRGQTERALAVARELVRIAPRNGAVLDALGRAQLAVGQPSNATITYRRLVELQATAVPARRQLARALVAADQPAAAAAELDRAIALDPADSAARRDRLAVEIRLRGIPAAIDLARAMQATGPAPLGTVLVADLLYRDRQFAAAAKTYGTAFRAAPSANLARRMFRSRTAAGDGAGGRAVLDRWLAEHGDDDTTRFVLAGGLIAAGQFDQAIAQHEILLARQPESATVLNNLAWLYHRRGDDRALDYARRAHRIKPAAPEIVDTLGWLLVERGELERGLELLRQANAAAPGNPEIGYHLAAALDRAGDAGAARALLATVLAGAQSFADAADAAAARALLRRLGE